MSKNLNEEIRSLNPCFNGRYSQRIRQPLTRKSVSTGVLILVLMEDTLRVAMFNENAQNYERLNPCFNGRYSQRYVKQQQSCSQVRVLILVLMEDTLRARNNYKTSKATRVLILVLMEDTLRVCRKDHKVINYVVLILVLMEDTLRVRDNVCVVHIA